MKYFQSDKGDSITIYVPGDSIPPGNPSLAGKKELKFMLTVKDIMDSNGFMQLLHQRRDPKWKLRWQKVRKDHQV